MKDFEQYLAQREREREREREIYQRNITLGASDFEQSDRGGQTCILPRAISSDFEQIPEQSKETNIGRCGR